MKVKKVLKKAGKIGKAMLEGFGEGIDRVMELRTEAKRYGVPVAVDPDTDVIVLDAKTLEQIRWMSTTQIKMIFGGKKLKIVNEPAALAQIRWMSSSQLEAIFGKDIPKNA